MTADHSIFPSLAYRELRRSFNEPITDNGRDLIPLALHFPKSAPGPRDRNPIRCSNLDIAPTILDMLDQDVPNSFLGMSLFSERSYYPKLLTNDFDSDPAFAAFSREEHAAWLEYLFRLACTDRIWPQGRVF